MKVAAVITSLSVSLFGGFYDSLTTDPPPNPVLMSTQTRSVVSEAAEVSESAEVPDAPLPDEIDFADIYAEQIINADANFVFSRGGWTPSIPADAITWTESETAPVFTVTNSAGGWFREASYDSVMTRLGVPILSRRPWPIDGDQPLPSSITELEPIPPYAPLDRNEPAETYLELAGAAPTSSGVYERLSRRVFSQAEGSFQTIEFMPSQYVVDLHGNDNEVTKLPEWLDALEFPGSSRMGFIPEPPPAPVHITGVPTPKTDYWAWFHALAESVPDRVIYLESRSADDPAQPVEPVQPADATPTAIAWLPGQREIE